MKIAVVSMIREPWGGSEELWADMARFALQEGHELIHNTFRFSQIPQKERRLMEKGLQLIHRKGFIPAGLPFFSRIPKKIYLTFTNLFINPYKNMFDKKPDYILYNGTSFSISKERHLLSILKRTGTHYGIIAHFLNQFETPRTKTEIEKLKKIYSDAQHVFFVSERTLRDTEQILDARISNAFIIRNPVNLESREIIDFPPPEPVQLAMVGILRIIHKGQDIVIKILSGAKWKNRKWHLNIYGKGEDELHLKNLVSNSGLEQHISFHGWAENIRMLWAKNHILLMPSLMEGMPLAVVEAMLCGRACVVTDTGGHTEWIEDNKEGWVAPEATLTSFEEAMERAWQDKNRWEAMGKNAHQKAIALYDPEPGKTLLKLIVNNSPN